MEAASSGRGSYGDGILWPASSSPMLSPGDPVDQSSYGERSGAGPSSDLLKIIGQLTGLSARVVRTEAAKEGHTSYVIQATVGCNNPNPNPNPLCL